MQHEVSHRAMPRLLKSMCHIAQLSAVRIYMSSLGTVVTSAPVMSITYAYRGGEVCEASRAAAQRCGAGGSRVAGRCPILVSVVVLCLIQSQHLQRTLRFQSTAMCCCEP